LTLLSICQAAAGASGFSAPATIIGNPDATAILLLRLLNKGGKKLAWKPLGDSAEGIHLRHGGGDGDIRLSQRPEIFPRLHRVGSQSILGATRLAEPV